MKNAELRKEVMNRKTTLFSERSSWDAHCREVTDYLLPYSGRYMTTDVNRGDKRNSKILDSSATRAARILSAALMAYNNPQSMPWFELTVSDRELAQSRRAKIWLRESTEIVHRVFNPEVSNTYGVIHKLYDELGAFGTGCDIMRPDFNTVIHNYPVTNGQFMLAENSKCEVDTCYREFSMTAAQMVEQFGEENVSDSAKRLVQEKNAIDTRFTVIHAIEPRRNDKRDSRKRDGKNKPFRSVYFEWGGRDDQILSEDGFDEFPVLAPRWDTTGGDVYGNSPGMECLGHIKQLQLMKEQEAKAVEYGVEPPLQGPSNLKERDVDRLPGGYTTVDQANPQGGVKEMWRVNLDVATLLVSSGDVRNQINQSFYTDLFTTFLSMSDTRRTKAEIDARGEEKFLLLGPVTSKLYRELHGPLIRFVFMELLKGGGLPPMPEELSGADLQIGYVSAMAMAQRAAGIGALDRFMFGVGQLAAIKPDVWDKVDTDRVIDEYAERLGIDPELIVAGPQVAMIRQTRAQAEAAKEQAMLLNQQADTGEKLSKTTVGDPNNPNALDALGQLAGQR